MSTNNPKLNNLEIAIDNAYQLALHDNDAFILARKNGFGASDSSILLGVNLWAKEKDLIEEKLRTTITDAERSIGGKENVRKGSDLEPLNLEKFASWSGMDVLKPDAMYRSTKHPFLTVDFDGIVSLSRQENTWFPVEAKFVSAYAGKYWDLTKSCDDPFLGSPKLCAGSSLKDHIEQEAKLYGIPPYYYTQIQHQMLLLDAPFGFMSVIFDKGWDYRAFKIYKDQAVQDALITEGGRVWDEIENRRS